MKELKPIRKVNNHLKAVYGMTTTQNGKRPIIEINKKKHKTISNDKSLLKRDRTLINTIVHEEMHAKHPKMHEKTVYKSTPRKVKNLTLKEKIKLYHKYRG